MRMNMIKYYDIGTIRYAERRALRRINRSRVGVIGSWWETANKSRRCMDIVMMTSNNFDYPVPVRNFPAFCVSADCRS